MFLYVKPSRLTVLSDLPRLLQNLRLRGRFDERGQLVHQAVRHGAVRHDGRNADGDDLVGVLLLDLGGGNVKAILQLGDQALYDHSLLLQAVRPGGVQPKAHRGDHHRHFSPINRLCGVPQSGISTSSGLSFAKT